MIRYSFPLAIKINTRIVQQSIIGGSILAAIGLVVLFGSLFSLYGQAADVCTSLDSCPASVTAKREEGVKFDSMGVSIGMGLLYTGSAVTAAGGGLLLIEQYRKKYRKQQRKSL